MILHATSTTKTITLSWSAIPNAEWYLFYAAGARVSNAPAVDKNGVAKTSVRFDKTRSPFEVVAIIRKNGVMSVDVGKYPQPLTEDDWLKGLAGVYVDSGL